MGVRISATPTAVRKEVVQITVEQRPDGPAANSIIVVENSHSGEKRARYLSWIGYHDLDEASLAEPGGWQLREPASPYSAEVAWQPFG